MAENSKIEWTDHTFNPWIGCTKVSLGCDGCYAEARMDTRLHRVNWGPGQPRQRTKTWGDPVKWNKQHAEFFAVHGRRQRVFCASLADVFDNEVDPAWRDELLGLIVSTPNLDWLLLTKRIGNVSKMLKADAWEHLPHVWLGATVVNQEEADRDIPKLLAVPARVHYISYEPALGGLWIPKYLKPGCERHGALDPDGKCEVCEGRGIWALGDQLAEHEKAKTRPGLSWAICGGESGPGARPMHPDWARSLRDQCAAAGVPYLFKQWGEWLPCDVDCTTAAADDGSERELPGDRWAVHTFADYQQMARIGKKAAGRMLDGVEHNGFPAAGR